MSGDPATAPVGIAPRWGLSTSDWHAHAVEEDAEHPCRVYVARCGHRLRGANTLYDDPPTRICEPCARWTEHRMAEATPGAPRDLVPPVPG